MWAINKAISTTEALALNLGNLKIPFFQVEHQGNEEDNEPPTNSDGNARKPKMNLPR
jgi:hypothetical protein